MPDQKLWLNKPQLLAWLVRANEEYGVWGRGTGKTEGPIALRSIHNQNLMPRGATGMIAGTYMQILTRTLPALEAGWKSKGYLPDVHYWVGCFPPKNLNIPKAIYHPRSPQHSIFWWNGHVRHFLSQDRPGLTAGKTLDAVDGDEAKHINHKNYVEEIAQANRGNRNVFGHLSEHHSVTFYTDMPTEQSGKWILDKEKEMNRQLVGEILNLQIGYNNLEAELFHPRTTDSRKVFLRNKMRGYAAALNELRKGSVFYSEASSLENIEVLGEEQFKKWKRELPANIYQSSVLNKRVIAVDNGFYPLLNLDRHTYDAFDYSFVDGLPRITGFIPDSRSDADVNRKAPIDIALDYGASINCLVCGQEFDKEYRVQKEFFVKNEDRLKELLGLFIAYYQYHPCKEVNFIYDHTAVGSDATRVFSYADEVSRLLEAAKWKVRRLNIGQQPRHDTRYRMWGMVLKEDHPQVKRIRINKSNCQYLLVSMQGAAVRTNNRMYEKDKRDEKNTLIPQETTTHFSDAVDTLYIGKFKHQIGYTQPSSALIF